MEIFVNFILKNLVTIITIICCGAYCYSQECTPPVSPQIPSSQEKADCQLVGQARTCNFEKQNYRYSNVIVYLLGKADDIERCNLEPRVANNVLFMSVGYSDLNHTIPFSFYLELTSYSTEIKEHKDSVKPFITDKHNLVIFLDDQLLSFEDSAPNGILITKKFSLERFSLRINYIDLRKMAEAKEIVIKLGETKIKLKSKDLEAIKDLTKTTAILKPPTYFM